MNPDNEKRPVGETTDKPSRPAGKPAVRKASRRIPGEPSRPPVQKTKANDKSRTRTEDELSKTKATPSGAASSGKAKERARKKESDSDGRHVSNIVKILAYVTFVLVTSVILSVFIIMVGNDVYAFVKSDEAVEITIPENATLDEVADILVQNRIIKYPGIFKLYAKLKKAPCDFYPGQYELTARIGYKELLTKFRPSVKSGVSWVTIPEGFTTDEIIDLLVGMGIGERDKYVDVINNYDFDYWFVKELGDDWAKDGRIYRLDGYLFPDSYELYNASSEVTVINKMLSRFKNIFSKEYRKGAENAGMTVDQVITLASIIEKEAGSQSDFGIVSSVFHNRMKSGGEFRFLESDATVVYAIHHDTGVRPKRVTPEDLKYDSPYNSYTHEGLPPGPIANPSNSAILAALNPTDTGYYFFVSSGSRTYFSVTRAEHEAKLAEIMAGMEEDPYAPDESGEN